jgi:hypothetical protein
MWVQHCPSHLNVADIGTKIVKPVAQYEFLQDRLTGTDPTVTCGHRTLHHSVVSAHSWPQGGKGMPLLMK